jgi:hypothetical protein
MDATLGNAAQNTIPRLAGPKKASTIRIFAS